MIGRRHHRSARAQSVLNRCRREGGSQLVEFAVALPLLVVFVVGIFDFSNAYTLKQKLTNVTRDAARVAAGDPANDLGFPSTATPASVADAFTMIGAYLAANNINTCGTLTPSTSGGLTWTATNTSGTCSITVIMNRGFYFPANSGTIPSVLCTPQGVGGSTIATAVATCVSIQYNYQWQFGRVVSLIGASDTLPSQITAISVVFNEN